MPMYHYSAIAFEGEFLDSHNNAIETTVAISSDLYTDVGSFANGIKSALHDFAAIYGGPYGTNGFNNINDLMGSIGPIENDIPQVVGIALDMQVVFEHQKDDGILLINSIKNYSDSMTSSSIAKLINKMRIEAVDGTVYPYHEDYMPIQISISLKEFKSPYYKKTLFLYGGHNDTFYVQDLTTGVTMNRVYTPYNRDYATVQINYIPGHTYHISSKFGNMYSGNDDFYMSFDWEGLLENLTATYLNLRPEHFAFWYGVFGDNVTRGSNFRREEWFVGVENLITSTYDAETCLKNVNTGGATTAGTTKCYVDYRRYDYDEDELQMTSNVFNTMSLPVEHTKKEVTRSVFYDPATNFTFSCANATTLRLFALFFV